MIFIYKQGGVVYANRKCEETLGYAREEFYSPDFDFFTLIAPEYRERLALSFKKHTLGEEASPFEYALVTKEGKRIAVLLNSKMITYEKENAILGIVTDISERKKAEESLKKSQEKYRHLAEYAPVAIYEIDCKSLRFKSVNEYMCALSGYSEKELLSLSPFDLLDAESKERFRDIMRKSVAGENIDQTVEFGVITKDGRRLWVSLSAKLVYKNGELDSAFVVAHDVTERRRAEEALKKSEEEYRFLFANFVGLRGKVVLARDMLMHP
ncbi:MAG: PAS domain S-box protein [Candidatus Bathyarchaeia archaeon]|jgi:PAS domain S-box-containing protein